MFAINVIVMEKSCPIVYERVDENLTRINALIVFTGLMFFIFSPAKWIIFFVVSDFAIRVIGGVKYSPICYGIKWSLKKLHEEPHLVNAGPKKFAAKIGLALTSTLSLLYILDYTLSFEILGIISLTAVGAETFFGYCIACKMYNLLQSIGIKL
jgi:hypothetical protein